MPQIKLSNYYIKNKVKLALNEDLYPSGDITSSLVKNNKIIKVKLISNQKAIVGGLEFAKQTFALIDKKIKFIVKKKEGSSVKKNDLIATIKGKAENILIGERVALNFISHISGIATKTNEFVKLVNKNCKICCTSANAVKIVNSLGVKKVIFLPDDYLAKYVASQTNVEIISWKGICIVHDQFNENEIHEIRKNNPGIKIIAHPECPPDVIKASDFAGSTSGMIKYVEDNQPKKVMMVTECSMSDNIQVENPNVEFIKPCNLCPHMKRITLPKILACLENETGEIIMDNETINKARIPVERMIAIGR